EARRRPVPKKSHTLCASSNVNAGAVKIGPTLHPAPVKAEPADVHDDDDNALISDEGTWLPPEVIPQVSGLTPPPLVVRRHIAPFHTGPEPWHPLLFVLPLQITLPA